MEPESLTLWADSLPSEPAGKPLYLHTQMGIYIYIYSKRKRAFLVAQIIWSLPAVLETLVQSQDWEDPLEKEMATYFTIFTWKILWMENLADYGPWSCKDSDMTEWLTLPYTYIYVYVHLYMCVCIYTHIIFLLFPLYIITSYWI